MDNMANIDLTNNCLTFKTTILVVLLKHFSFALLANVHLILGVLIIVIEINLQQIVSCHDCFDCVKLAFSLCF